MQKGGWPTGHPPFCLATLIRGGVGLGHKPAIALTGQIDVHLQGPKIAILPKHGSIYQALSTKMGLVAVQLHVKVLMIHMEAALGTVYHVLDEVILGVGIPRSIHKFKGVV